MGADAATPTHTWAFHLTNATVSRILMMKKYSIAEAAELAGVNRATVYRWIQRKLVPAPLTEVVAGVHVTYWTDKELVKLKEHRTKRYWGQGSRRKRKKRVE